MKSSVLFVLCLVALASAKPPSSRGGNRIVGGTPAEPNSIPYQIVYYIQDSFACGGSIYNENYVITAAHCCDRQSAQEVSIIAGDHVLGVDDGTEQPRNVAEIIMHEEYDSSVFINDICLLRLEEPLDLNSVVQPVPMPAQFEEITSDVTTVSGWGTVSADGPISPVLQYVTIPVISDEECADKYAVADLNVYQSNMCAGEEGKDHCFGDSGGPLTCDGVQCGIVSWAIGCATAPFPGVNTQISYFIDWIEDNTTA